FELSSQQFGIKAEVFEIMTAEAHEQKFQRRSGKDKENALKVTYEDEEIVVEVPSEDEEEVEHFNKATVECYQCHQLGHFRMLLMKVKLADDAASNKKSAVTKLKFWLTSNTMLNTMLQHCNI
ncbi:hypothetical protein A2U01_0014592, partial [Trifolium medium]|nr:hypothetical protein [Trifolium medium]